MKQDYDFSMVVEQATEEQMDRINDAFVKAVEKEGLSCGGGFKPLEEKDVNWNGNDLQFCRLGRSFWNGRIYK